MRSLLTRWIAGVTACALIAGASPAFAQKGGKKGEDPNVAEAKKHMEAGAAFFNDPSGHKCEEAFREFEKAYELVGSLNALKGMGFCAMELERDGEAIALFEKFLSEKGPQVDRADKQQIETDLKALKAAVARVTIRTDKPGVKIADKRTPARGYPITNRYTISGTELPLGLHPGAHEIVATVDGAPEQVWKVEIQNGGSFEHTFDFEADKPVQEDKPIVKAPPARPIPKTVFIVGGVTVAAAIGGAVVGGLASGAKADFEAANGKEPDTKKLEDMRSNVVTLNLVADVAFGLALAGAVTTVVLFVKRPEKAADPTKDALIVSPWANPRGGGLMVLGAF